MGKAILNDIRVYAFPDAWRKSSLLVYIVNLEETDKKAAESDHEDAADYVYSMRL